MAQEEAHTRKKDQLKANIRRKGLPIQTLQDILKNIHNLTLFRYQTSYRLYRGGKLAQKGVRLQDIASTLGYKHDNNFTTAFKNRYSVTPTQYVNHKHPVDVTVEQTK